MPKVKTHSGTKKRFSVTGSGKVKFKKCGKSHLNNTKNGKRLRRLNETGYLPDAQAKNIKELLPYA